MKESLGGGGGVSLGLLTLALSPSPDKNKLRKPEKADLERSRKQPAEKTSLYLLETS